MKNAFKKVYKMSIPDCYNTIMYGSDENYPEITKKHEKLQNIINFFNNKTKRI